MNERYKLDINNIMQEKEKLRTLLYTTNETLDD